MILLELDLGLKGGSRARRPCRLDPAEWHRQPRAAAEKAEDHTEHHGQGLIEEISCARLGQSAGSSVTHKLAMPMSALSNKTIAR
eukprot:CAMPEP_0170610698 /NCGR_PEP_ID=MMETSP0224-20130122/22799_1 /TAXON_ID=285029 /ORGANISM="Togula jolla, Strain CCCM 725" /LENGTH=84 /DNA_ID=CAMNT_0010936093 /DNA_START=203 /DNA_END=458 /DNA_ORIENTATION=-